MHYGIKYHCSKKKRMKIMIKMIKKYIVYIEENDNKNINLRLSKEKKMMIKII